MIDPVVSPLLLSGLYEAIKFWLPVSAFFFGIYKGWDWVKNSINEIKTDVKDVKTGITTQTVALTDEIKEQRQDFRAFFLPLLTLAQGQSTQVQPVRAKRTRKTIAKK
jgi:hypothetical protein